MSDLRWSSSNPALAFDLQYFCEHECGRRRHIEVAAVKRFENDLALTAGITALGTKSSNQINEQRPMALARRRMAQWTDLESPEFATSIKRLYRCLLLPFSKY